MILDPSIKVSRWFRWALAAAKQSEHGIYKMGAVIVNNGKLVAIGHNKNKTHPDAKNYTTKIHAELDALIGWRIPNRSTFEGNMYVVRLTNGGAMATSKPCKDCMVLIKEADLSSVTYIDEYGMIKTDKL